MVFGIVGDVHISDVPPSTRKDDYRTVVLNKLQFIVNRSNEKGYEALLFVGDLFHKKIPFHNSHLMISALMQIFESSKAPIYIVAGNHDIHGNMSTFENQPLNVLVQSGVVHLLDNFEPIFYDKDGVTISLNGKSFSPLLDSKEHLELYNLNHKEADYKISMFHQMILPDNKHFFADYVNFCDLINCNADIIIDGHYHEGFEPSVQNYGNKKFINGGSITRGTAEQSNLDKVPKYVELKIDSLTGVSYIDIEIPHLSSDEVFDFTVIERNRKKKDMHEFMDGLSEMENQSLATQEPIGIIQVLKTMGMTDALGEIAMKYLDQAYSELA